MGFLKKLSIFVLSNVYIKRLKVPALSISGLVWFGLVWFGLMTLVTLVGSSFHASLEPQRKTEKRALWRGHLAEAAHAHHPLWDWAEYPLSDG
jgi:hypothetical protein